MVDLHFKPVAVMLEAFEAFNFVVQMAAFDFNFVLGAAAFLHVVGFSTPAWIEAGFPEQSEE